MDSVWTKNCLAIVENIPAVVDWVNGLLEERACPMKVQMQIDVAMDEVLANIVHYAYAGRATAGDMTIQVTLRDDPRSIRICFIDSGVPYNPLTAKEPDTTLSADERPIGGLGIFLVKKTMDTMDYVYRDGKNVLTVQKAF